MKIFGIFPQTDKIGTLEAGWVLQLLVQGSPAWSGGHV
jgi:hypothetical protein